MQINIINTGPTMAASEPPEPPPRNPERINATLHKLAESKNIKSLDSSVLNDKTVNNNKPLKTILSLDTATSATTVASGNATTGKLHTTVNNLPSPSGPAGTIAASATGLYFNKQQHKIQQQNDLTPSGGESSTSPLSSNGSNHTLTSPMTIEHQQQQQLHRINYQTTAAAGTTTSAAAAATLIKGNSGSGGGLETTSVASHMTQQQNGSGQRGSGVGGLLTEQQQQQHNLQLQQLNNHHLINGGSTVATNTTTSAATGSSGSSLGSSSNNSNHSNSLSGSNAFNINNLITTHSTTAALTATHNLQTSLDSPTKLREENERLNTEIHRLRKLLENSPEGAVGGIDLSDSNSCGDGQSTDGSGSNTQQRIDRLEQELRSAKNQLMSLRIERKKLRSDKNELVGQVKQLCVSLQEKEQELRDFIRNYQDRVRESESNNAKLTGDRERERWQLLKQARDEAERSLALAQQLSARDLQLQKLQEQLQRQMSGCMSDQESLLSFAPLTPPSAASGLLNQMPSSSAGVVNYRNDDSGRGNSNSLSAFSNSSGNTAGDRNSCSNDSVLRNNSDRESTGGDINFSDGISDNGPCITVDPDSISLVSSQNMYQYGTPKERSPTLSPLNSAAYSRSVEQLGSPVDSDGPGAVARKFAPKSSGAALGARNGRGGTWGSISRVFARSRNKNKALSADGATEYNDYSWSPLSEEGYAEKLRLLREASQIPMERWRASQVLAWLEVALGMPQYSTRCSENVKSGKVLLELNDIELEAGLGLAHPMHRKKLRLAIEEQRRPEMVRYPMITQLGHTWVASEWLPDIGLPQYAESFLHSLVDARMLDTLSKKELEKFLGVTRKFHQASIVHGIHVLRIVKYDRQTLAMRRVQSENVDTDPIVWTNQRFIRWARSIDLAEYADNLKDSGVHGGLVVLEPSFSGDTMATALGIPPSKNIIRRHLSTEFDALILPARATLGQGIRSGCGIVPITGPGGLQHYGTADRRSSGSLRISAWKGSQSSLSKAFRFNAKSSRSGSSIGDRTSVGNSTSPTPSFSSSEGGGGIYATIGGSHHFTHNFPPPTTAPPPPPTQHSHYQQQHYYQQQQQQLQHQQQQNSTAAATAAHRVSAPPSGSGIEAISDPNLLYEQHRRVKSINDIGATAASAYGSTSALARDRLSSGLNSGADSASICSGLSGTGAIIHENNHGASTASSNSPV